MDTHVATQALAVWEDGDGASVHYSAEVIQELRRLAVDGFNAFRHGGKEIGGILYGERGESGPVALAFAPLDCEHALGPRFILSENDHAAMAGLMEPHDGLEAIGWFRAHTRSGLELDAKDRELFERYFPHAPGVCLILKPTQWGPATGAFYLRQPSGEIGPRAIREFAIELPKRQAVERISPAAETSPPPVIAPTLDLVVAEPVLAPAAPKLTALARPRSFSQPRRSWPWAMCAGVLLGAMLTLALESRPARNVHADTAPARDPAADVPTIETPDRALPGAADPSPVASDADRIAPVPAASAAARPPAIPSIAARTQQPSMRSEHAKPMRHQTPLPRIASAAPAPPASLPAPPAAGLDVAAAPKSLDFALNSLLPAPPAPAPSPAAITTHLPRYSGPPNGRVIWTGDLARRGLIEMDGSRVSPGSLTGALPSVPISVRVMPAEFGRDGLTVFTSDSLRDQKTEPPSQSNGWNALRFKFDPVRAAELVLLETPNAANDYKRLALRNDGRPYFVVLMEWDVQR